jgi:hypothetical protein
MNIPDCLKTDLKALGYPRLFGSTRAYLPKSIKLTSLRFAQWWSMKHEY